MRKLITTIILLTVTQWIYACSCNTPTLLANIYQSDFIATAKILKATKDPNDQEYHNIEIELIDVYKGTRVTKLKIWSAELSSCAFFTPIGTTWLIFASYDKDKVLSFHYCGGSQQIDRQFNLKEYSGLDRKYKSEIELKLDVLKFFRDKKMIPIDKTQLKISWPTACMNDLKGFDGDSKDFMIYECIVNEDMSVTNISAVRNFKNNKLAKAFTACIPSNLKNNDNTKNAIPKKIKQYLVYYFYPNEKGNQSFISVFDL